MQTILFEIRSVSALLMHRYPGAKPSDPDKKRPRNVTQEWLDKIARADWLSSAYWARKSFHVPVDMLEAAIRNAARQTRGGKLVERFLMVEDDFVALRIFESPADSEGFFSHGDLEDWYRPPYIDVRGVIIGTAKIDRCRPIFPDWGLSFSVRFNDLKLQVEQVKEFVGIMEIGDNRPRYGRSRIVSAVEQKQAA